MPSGRLITPLRLLSGLTLVAIGAYFALQPQPAPETTAHADNIPSVAPAIATAAPSVAIVQPSQPQPIAPDIISELTSILDAETPTKEPPLPRQLSSLTPLGAQLNDYLEQQDVGYLDSSFYPFDVQTEALLRRYSTSGKMLLFDNSQSKIHLESYGKNSGDLVADFYGTGSPAELIVATSITLENGGIEYMVLPIARKEEGEDLAAKVKLAIELFQKEQHKKSNPS